MKRKALMIDADLLKALKMYSSIKGVSMKELAEKSIRGLLDKVSEKVYTEGAEKTN